MNQWGWYEWGAIITCATGLLSLAIASVAEFFAGRKIDREAKEAILRWDNVDIPKPSRRVKV